MPAANVVAFRRPANDDVLSGRQRAVAAWRRYCQDSARAQIDRTEAFLEEFFAALHDDAKGEAHV
jgi:hypothetical protein